MTTSSLRTTASDAERDNPRVAQIMERAEQHYKLGELNLKDKNMDAARTEFDKAVDSVLESGMDVRSNPKLQTFYLQLVERVYRMEATMPRTTLAGRPPSPFVASSTDPTDAVTVGAQQPGFLREQKFEPSPLDELSRLDLTPDERSTLNSDFGCKPVRHEQIKLRSMYLGMGLEEILNRLPLLKLDKVDPYGRRRGSLFFNDHSSKKGEFKGVAGMAFTFINSRVAYIAIAYDNSITWNGLDDFVARTSEALSLPKVWRGGYRQTRSLTCGDLHIEAEFMYPASLRTPMLKLTDLAATRAYIGRVNAAVEKRRLEEEKKRQSFKP